MSIFESLGGGVGNSFIPSVYVSNIYTRIKSGERPILIHIQDAWFRT